MDGQFALSNLNAASELVESAYNSLNAEPTNSDLETKVKNNLLVKIKNNLTDLIILSDLLNELVENPGDETVLETTLDLVSDTTEILS